MSLPRVDPKKSSIGIQKVLSGLPLFFARNFLLELEERNLHGVGGNAPESGTHANPAAARSHVLS